MPAETLLKLVTVSERTGLGKTAIYSRMGRDEFPRPVQLGTSVRWVESEIEAWIREQIEARDKAA